MNNSADKRPMGKSKLYINIFLVVISALVLFLTMNFSMKRIEERDKETTAEFVSDIVDTNMEKSVELPIQVAKSMTANTFLRDYLMNYKGESEETAKEFEEKVCGYLNEIKEKNNFSMTYFTFAKDLKYYSNAGFEKTLEFSEGAYDNWYLDFINSKADYSIDIQNDIMNSEIWTIFVDCRMEDGRGNLLGVCTVGLQVDFLHGMLQQLCEKYGVSIVLTDDNGIIQLNAGENTHVAGDRVPIEDYLQNKGKNVDGAYVYYSDIDALNWHLLTLNTQNIYTERIARNIYLIFGIIILLIYSILMYASLSTTTVTRQARKELDNDSVTGLLNEKGYRAKTDLQRASGQWVQFTVKILGLEEAGEELDQQAYNEELNRLAKLLRRTFRSSDIIGYAGNDIFYVFCNEMLSDNIIELKRNVILKEADHELTSTEGKEVGRISAEVVVNKAGGIMVQLDS